MGCDQCGTSNPVGDRFCAWDDDVPDAEDARLAASIAMIPIDDPEVDEPAGPWLERAARAASRLLGQEVTG